MNGITIFNHLGNNIRVMTDEQGEPWFVLNDICGVLGITNTRNVAGRLDGDCVRPADVTDNLGRLRQTNVVNEAGLYEVIIRSDKPEATQFRRWVTSEVLPSIRKHGMYATPATIEDMIANPDTIKDMGPNKFCRWLLDNDFAFRNGQGKIIPMQDAVNRGILTLTERIDKAGKIRPQLLVTPAGQSYFAGILSK